MLSRYILVFQSLLLIFLPKKKGRGMIGLFLFCLLWGTEIRAQVQVYTEQPLAFGSFVVGNSGGTVTISHEGERTVTGDMVLVNPAEQVFPMVFGIEAPLGAVVHIQKGSDVQLSGDHGGKMILSLGESSHGTSFVSEVAPPDRTYVSFSATLSAGSRMDAPFGSYSGNASIITFIQE